MADAVTFSDCKVWSDTLSSGMKQVTVRTPATVDATNTLAITLANYGITTLVAIESYVFTTADSVMTGEANTCAVASGVLTVTIAAGTTDDVRVIRIWGY